MCAHNTSILWREIEISNRKIDVECKYQIDKVSWGADSCSTLLGFP